MKINECYLRSVSGWNSHYGDIVELSVPSGQNYETYRINLEELKDYIQSNEWVVQEPKGNRKYRYLVRG